MSDSGLMERGMERAMEQASNLQVIDREEIEHMEHMEQGSRPCARACVFPRSPTCVCSSRAYVHPLFHVFHMFYLRKNNGLGAKTLFHTPFHACSIPDFQGVTR